MTLYIAIWAVAEAIAVAMFISALRAGGPFVARLRMVAWSIAYPVVIGWTGWDMIADFRRLGTPMPIDFVIPVLMTVVGIVLSLAVRAYAKDPGE